jgi:hypothetical protein
MDRAQASQPTVQHCSDSMVSLARELALAQRCPRFERCSAAVCPLLPSSGGHGRGERICPYLREAVKPGGEARLRCSLPEEVARTIVEAIPRVIALHGAIARALRRASVQGSKLDAAAKARESVARQPLRPAPHADIRTQTSPAIGSHS